MIKKIIIAILLLTGAYIYLYYHPISIERDFAMSGSILSAEGEALSPCSVNFDGRVEYYVLGNRPSGLTGTLQLSNENTITSTIYLELSSVTVDGTTLQVASGIRYRGKALGPVSCSIYFNKSRSACILLDHKTIFSLGSPEEAAVLFDQVAQLALPA